jgi:hypothetical protein
VTRGIISKGNVVITTEVALIRIDRPEPPVNPVATDRVRPERARLWLIACGLKRMFAEESLEVLARRVLTVSVRIHPEPHFAVVEGFHVSTSISRCP